MYPCTCVRVNEFRFDCSRKFYDRWKTICWNVALFRDAVELRETWDVGNQWRASTVTHDCTRKMDTKNRTKKINIYKAQRRILVNKRPERYSIITCVRLVSDPSRRAWWVKTALPTFLSPLRRSESISLYRIYHIHVYFSKHTEIRSTLR